MREDLAAVRAPDFPAELDWIHTGGRALRLADFRGKLLFLDFCDSRRAPEHRKSGRISCVQPWGSTPRLGT